MIFKQNWIAFCELSEQSKMQLFVHVHRCVCVHPPYSHVYKHAWDSCEIIWKEHISASKWVENLLKDTQETIKTSHPQIELVSPQRLDDLMFRHLCVLSYYCVHLLPFRH